MGSYCIRKEGIIMYEILTKHPVIAIIFLVIVVIAAIYLAIKGMQNVGMEKIRGYVYKLFVYAENEFQYGENEQKFEYVVQLARSQIPSPFNLVITESLLRKVIQAWFNICKDLLDDGKINRI